MKPVSLIVVLAALIINNFGGKSPAPEKTAPDASRTEKYTESTSKSSTNPVDFWGKSVISVFNHIEDKSEDISENAENEENESSGKINLVVNPTVEVGDYTAGGYLPTTVNSQYKSNGLKYVGDNFGILFREGEEEDLYNWVTAGYTKWRTVDTRIASRKGGVDNPRIAGFLSLDNSDFWFNAKSDTYCMVTVMSEKYNGDNNNIPSDLRAFIEENAVQNGCKTTAKYTKIANYCSTHDLDKELNLYAGAGPGIGKQKEGIKNTYVRYNCRNYCGDVIFIDPGGEGVVGSNIDPTGVVKSEAAAGVDYILTCEDDPTAFKLVKDEELKRMYIAERKGQNLFAGTANQFFGNTCDSELYGKGRLYHQAYVGVKPGVYRCTVTIPATGDKFPIVIENLPLNYEELRWGCTNQEEMDFCVQFMQNWELGVFGQYYHQMMARASANALNVFSNTATYEDKLKAVEGFNDWNLKTYEGESIQLKKTEEAAEWASHLPHGVAIADIDRKKGGLRNQIFIDQEMWEVDDGLREELSPRCTLYDAVDSIMYGADDCESLTAAVSCLYNVLGYTTRNVTGGNHMFFEVKVPGSITKSGKDQWMMIDNGCISSIKSGYMVKSYVGSEMEGLDNSWWPKCYNERIASREVFREWGTE